MKKISIIVPVYYNENNLIPLYDNLKENVFSKINIDYELIFVDDGSGDNSFNVIKELAKNDPKIKAVRLSRNFGAHSAVLAGLKLSTGDCVSQLSADLQDPPSLVIEMIKKWEEGNNVVLAVRKGRNDKLKDKMFSALYYKLLRKMALKNYPKKGFDSCLLSRMVVNILVSMNEKNTNISCQVIWSGFKTATIEYQREKRTIGKSRWTFSKKIKLMADSILGFSYLPVRIVLSIGFLSIFAAFVWAIAIVTAHFSHGIEVPGYTSLALMILGTFSILEISIGVLGEYIWRAFDASRNRPPFIIEEYINMDVCNED